MDAWDAVGYVFVTALLVANAYIAWRCWRVLKFLHKSRKMANAIHALYKNTESKLAMAVAITIIILLAFVPAPTHLKSAITMVCWGIMTVLIAVNITRVDRMLTDPAYHPDAPVDGE